MGHSLRSRVSGWWVLCLGLVVAACAPSGFPNQPAPPASPDDPALTRADEGIIEIEYWQYDSGAEVTAMDILIEQFHEQYPNIRVLHNHETEYADFSDVMAARVPAGLGPDVVTLYYGWQAEWIKAGYLAPLPHAYFSHNMVRREFVPIVEAGFLEGELYTLPTAVRVAGLFYNKDLMLEAGLDPDRPPATLAELEAQAAQCTVRNQDGSFEIIGLPISVNGQTEFWFREVLLPQFGQSPLSDDLRTILWNASPGGYAAWAQLLKFQTELTTGDAAGFDSDPNVFISRRACFLIDTSTRLEIISANAPDLDFGVVELPLHNEIRSTFGRYWGHGITQKGASSPERLDASITFLQFITRPEAGQLWVDVVGELPAQRSVIEDIALRNDPLLEPFLTGLAYAHAPFVIDENLDQQAVADAYFSVVEAGADPIAQLDAAVEKVQALYDLYWGN